MTAVPVGAVQAGGGSTAGLQDQDVLLLGLALLIASGGAFALTRRSTR